MATPVGEIRDWLAEFDDSTLVGVDDGGLTLRVVGRDEYLEIGGSDGGSDVPVRRWALVALDGKSFVQTSVLCEEHMTPENRRTIELELDLPAGAQWPLTWRQCDPSPALTCRICR